MALRENLPDRTESAKNRVSLRGGQAGSTPEEEAAAGPSQQPDHVDSPDPPEPNFWGPDFWDNLSEVPLCTNAVSEFNRRNKHDKKGPSSGARYEAPPIDPSAIPERLKKPIKQSAFHGGPDLTDLRGHHKAEGYQVTATQRSFGFSPREGGKEYSSDSSVRKPKVEPFDAALEQHLIDHHILPHGYKYPDGSSPPSPTNMDEIRAELANNPDSFPTDSISEPTITEEAFQEFLMGEDWAEEDSEVEGTAMWVIRGPLEDGKCIGICFPFVDLEPITDGSIVPIRPREYTGARPEELDPRVLDKLSSNIFPYKKSQMVEGEPFVAPIVPNYFVELKGPRESMELARRKMLYAGAAGSRAMRSLQCYVDPELGFDNKAYTLSCTYHRGQLEMYTNHPVAPRIEGERTGYVMTLIKAWNMTSNLETFREGVTWFRNGKAWAKRMRDAAIRQANKAARSERSSR